MTIKYTRKMTLSPIARLELEKFISSHHSIRRAAEALGISKTMIYNWLAGKACITSKHAAQIEILTNYMCSKDTLLIRELCLNAKSEIFLKPEDKDMGLYDYIKKYYIRPKINQFDMTSEEYFSRCVHADLVDRLKRYEINTEENTFDLIMLCSIMFGGTETNWSNILQFFKYKAFNQEKILQKS